MKALRVASIFAALILAVSGRGAHGACGEEKEICASGSPWYSANGATVRFEDPTTGDYGVWTFSFPEPTSMVIDEESRYQGQTTRGRIILVSGRVMLTKGLDLKESYEIDTIDGPVLFYQLVVSLLSQVFPAGPGKFKETLIVDLAENARGIKIATPSASGFFGAPWKLKGRVDRKSSEVIAFSLAFECQIENSRRTFALRGEWRKTVQVPTLDPNMSLEGWQAYVLGPVSIKQDRGTILDYTAQRRPIKLRTLGELQESIRKDEASSSRTGPPDGSKDSTRGSP
jgi:hypothetical protein